MTNEIDITNKETTNEDLTDYIAALILSNVGGRLTPISNNGKEISVYDIYSKSYIKFSLNINEERK